MQTTCLSNENTPNTSRKIRMSAEDIPDPDSCYKSGCIFCRIAHQKAPGGDKAELLPTGDPDFACFRDHRPAGKHHYLVVPRKHIKSFGCLTKRDIPLVKKLDSLAKKVLEDQGADMSDVAIGFHWPFYTVGHLHIHAISPTNEMNLLQKFEFSRAIFGSVEKAIQALEKRRDPD